MEYSDIRQVDSKKEWVDIVKGVGVTLVVMGHIIVLIPQMSVLFDIIYLFHVPLFFFISGFLFKRKSNQIGYIIKKVKHLIVPYFAVIILISIIMLILGFADEADLFRLFRQYVWGGEQLRVVMQGAFIPMWFLRVLFLTQVIYNFLQNLLVDKYINIIVLLLYGLNIFQTMCFSTLSLPWSVHVLSLSIPIFHIGYMIRKLDGLSVGKPNLVILLGLLALLSPVFLSNNSIDTCMSYGGIPILTLLCSILVIIGLIHLAQKITGSIIANVLSKLGRASLAIMCFHFPVYLCFFYLEWVHLESSNVFFVVMFWTIIVISICYAIYLVFNKFRVTRILYLGKK